MVGAYSRMSLLSGNRLGRWLRVLQGGWGVHSNMIPGIKLCGRLSRISRPGNLLVNLLCQNLGH